MHEIAKMLHPHQGGIRRRPLWHARLRSRDGELIQMHTPDEVISTSCNALHVCFAEHSACHVVQRALGLFLVSGYASTSAVTFKGRLLHFDCA